LEWKNEKFVLVVILNIISQEISLNLIFEENIKTYYLLNNDLCSVDNLVNNLTLRLNWVLKKYKREI
jgi:hypothetical protein